MPCRTLIRVRHGILVDAEWYPNGYADVSAFQASSTWLSVYQPVARRVPRVLAGPNSCFILAQHDQLQCHWRHHVRWVGQL